jgi:predicted phage gp36 major capsid-like protein
MGRLKRMMGGRNLKKKNKKLKKEGREKFENIHKTNKKLKKNG